MKPQDYKLQSASGIEEFKNLLVVLYSFLAANAFPLTLACVALLLVYNEGNNFHNEVEDEFDVLEEIKQKLRLKSVFNGFDEDNIPSLVFDWSIQGHDCSTGTYESEDYATKKNLKGLNQIISGKMGKVNKMVVRVGVSPSETKQQKCHGSHIQSGEFGYVSNLRCESIHSVYPVLEEERAFVVVEHQEYLLKFWQKALNPLTWTEILHQVLVAAGFRSKHGTLPREPPNKFGLFHNVLPIVIWLPTVLVYEIGMDVFDVRSYFGKRDNAFRVQDMMLLYLYYFCFVTSASVCCALSGFASMHEFDLMAKYGLSPGTLKGELFSILLLQGNNGLKVSELAVSFSIAQLNLASQTHELELLISSTLSSDVTLFERISSSAYRLRINSVTKESENFQSDSEDFGSVDDDSKDGDGCSNAGDSDNDSGTLDPNKLEQKNCLENSNNMLTVYNEIDESHPGEAWLLGLMESEYSDLSIEEKLEALVALLELLSDGASIRMEEPILSASECVSNINHHGSGAKIKRSTAKQPIQLGSYSRQILGNSEVNTMSVIHPVDSLASLSNDCGKKKISSKRKDGKEREVEGELHPMQSIFLGSDRRYNRYWLFLGPCNANDPGHKRIYFESSEDGHWEVIDTEEAMCTLLSALDRRGAREAFLLASLEKREASLCRAMSSMLNDTGIRLLTQSDQSELNMSREDSSSAVSDVDNNLFVVEIQNNIPVSSAAVVPEPAKKGEQQKEKWVRLQAFDAWLWNSFYSELNAVKHSRGSYLESLARCQRCHDLYWRDEKHCKICHTTFELDFNLEEIYAIHIATCQESTDTDKFPKHKVLSSQLQSLKAAVYAIESIMPEDALVGAWRKYAHNLWVKRLRRTSTLVEFLRVLADFVNAINEDWLYECNIALGNNSVLEEIIANFPTMPQTSSTVALWLVKLDALIAPHLERVESQKKQELASRFKGVFIFTNLITIPGVLLSASYQSLNSR
ncbi:unnamed protein product [Ilex paraguariensis]|uniref:Uncharacterized protein n=1 Tax=Ilex paraguariensis TaxID=185542 RepID=A0ABC8TN57_9AQUA